MKRLIVNADDFGNTSGVNEAQEAAELAKSNLKLGVGLHFDLLFKDRDFLSKVGESPDPQTLKMIVKEFHEQMQKLEEIIGAMPTHIDIHHHGYIPSAISAFLAKFSKENHIPLRKAGAINFIDSFSTPDPKDATVEKLIKILKSLPDGVSELMTHPGYSSAELRQISSMSDCRELELQTLTSP
ncbi:ChbG/HpnK family deacetylase, partial [Candidatus Gottesmanbacteria bacterium]|nr:ChbG/HpnK family deacetylase [Candidatus Gottesmanbacteria bacterium]